MWASIGAAAAGVGALVTVVRLRQRSLAAEHVTTRLRDVQEVLSDCYRKIREIESHIPDVSPARGGLAGLGRSAGAGAPVLDG